MRSVRPHVPPDGSTQATSLRRPLADWATGRSGRRLERYRKISVV